MINPSDIKLEALPYLPIEQRSTLPPIPGIYLAIDSTGAVQYVGRSTNIRNRWAGHHRHDQLKAIGGVKIAYIALDEVELLADVEKALIEYFQPILSQPERRKQRIKRNAISTTFRFTPEVKNAITESAEKNNRSENQQAEFLIKVGYLHTFGIDLKNISDREIMEHFDRLTSETEDNDD